VTLGWLTARPRLPHDGRDGHGPVSLAATAPLRCRRLLLPLSELHLGQGWMGETGEESFDRPRQTEPQRVQGIAGGPDGENLDLLLTRCLPPPVIPREPLLYPRSVFRASPGVAD
jgi:hypothetical protein